MTPEEQLKILSRTPDSVHFSGKIAAPLNASGVDILQVNVGKRCNLSCKHCHVQAGPDRAEQMTPETIDECLAVFAAHPISTMDITGGSPEMNSGLPRLINGASALGRRVMVRSNLVILLEDEFSHLIDLYTDCGVEIVSSLPAYAAANVDRQRGPDVFSRIIRIMQKLNERGYGRPGTGLMLHLVHNPVGAYLPGAQQSLEDEYRRRLYRDFGVAFNSLFSLTNCPVGRYLEFLIRSDNYESYMRALINAFNRSALENVMCRTTLSVGWDGTLYDCDFNQMLDLPVNHGAPNHISRFDMVRLQSRAIVIGNHCFSCTAGAGSSCQGALE